MARNRERDRAGFHEREGYTLEKVPLARYPAARRTPLRGREGCVRMSGSVSDGSRAKSGLPPLFLLLGGMTQR